MTAITEDRLLDILRACVEDLPSISHAARVVGVSRSHLWRVIHGKKPLTTRLARWLGYERVVMYRPVKVASGR